MPRIARGFREGYHYHILNRGNGKQEIFHDINDYRVFINLIRDAKKRWPINIHAYCLMPNHFHMVLATEDDGNSLNLSRFMQWLMTSHVRRHHSFYNTSGHLWQGRFKSFIIQENEYFLTVLRYIEGNPVRGRLVNSVKDWLWSSHLERIGTRKREILDVLPVELPVKWTEYVDSPLTDKEIAGLKQSIRRQCPYGEREWQVQVSRELGLESTIRAIGRPKIKKRRGEK